MTVDAFEGPDDAGISPTVMVGVGIRPLTPVSTSVRSTWACDRAGWCELGAIASRNEEPSSRSRGSF